MSTTTTESGLLIEEIRVGSGDTAVSGHRQGALHRLADRWHQVRFEQGSRRAFEFPLGQRTVIAGWDEGVQRCASAACADHPAASRRCRRGGVIPPNATLVFEVELLDVA